ncbi:hypothetical protein NitYY0814_C0359 [Nitratiruptor sp. YY08-14]|nr:hypothetical protein NitYY0810_C0359 [Nitratiruptor sp. YY08-10]BCD63532.1 hypothetical protein NitYY0814_C0359 [Nitratiruptor sp. YY08-14]BCD83084.1 hypothetical protein NrS2_34 [Nitratiruptor phage NrS-2]BCD83150.1 hypothetical protein NrS3_34 [Nitratiruptor phage NrS-3]
MSYWGNELIRLSIILILLSSLHAKHLHKEKVYQKIFCNKVHGQMEYRLPDRSRVDCLTSNYAFEVDFGRKAFESVGQALYYAMMTGKKPGIVLIQETRRDNRYIGKIKRLAKKYGIAVFVINRKFEVRRVK